MTSAETVLGPTPQQKQVAAAHLVSTRDKLIETVKDFPPHNGPFSVHPANGRRPRLLNTLRLSRVESK